jgi:hypothetical protein
MTAYLSDKATSPLAPSPTHGQAGNLQTLYCTVALTAALTTADTFAFFTLPANARVHAAILKCTDIDTNGSPTVTINVGDAGSATRYFSASTVGQAGTVDVTMQAAGRLYKTTAKTAIVGSVQANAATGVAGTLELVIHFVVEDSTTTP